MPNLVVTPSDFSRISKVVRKVEGQRPTSPKRQPQIVPALFVRLDEDIALGEKGNAIIQSTEEYGAYFDTDQSIEVFNSEFTTLPQYTFCVAQWESQSGNYLVRRNVHDFIDTTATPNTGDHLVYSYGLYRPVATPFTHDTIYGADSSQNPGSGTMQTVKFNFQSSLVASGCSLETSGTYDGQIEITKAGVYLFAGQAYMMDATSGITSVNAGKFQIQQSVSANTFNTSSIWLKFPYQLEPTDYTSSQVSGSGFSVVIRITSSHIFLGQNWIRLAASCDVGTYSDVQITTGSGTGQEAVNTQFEIIRLAL